MSLFQLYTHQLTRTNTPSCCHERLEIKRFEFEVYKKLQLNILSFCPQPVLLFEHFGHRFIYT